MPDDAIQVSPHGNSGLFSDHYLDVTLPDNEAWTGLAADAGSVMNEVARLLESYTPSRNEAQTEDDLVKPVLRLLGHTFEIQPTLSTTEGTKRPDYVFYRDQASLDSNKNVRLDEGLLAGKSFAVGDAKYWDRPLDASLKDSSKSFDNRNPSYQISFYMRHAATDWGILTNGRMWRLYHRDSAHRLDCFYEVDLPALIASGDVSMFVYFYAFFRRAAFEEGSPLSVGEFLAGSTEYARSIEDSLRLQVYDALRHIAQGFLDYERNNLKSEPEDLQEIYDAALILLYRILFVLYAEARNLLPVNENAAYRSEYSLYTMKRNIAEKLDGGSRTPAGFKQSWSRLTDLFDAISSGHEDLGIPTYNGGLFDVTKHPFLSEKIVGDRHLQLALDKLARVNGQFVDYRDLSERHLGTIYEGLLEYHLEASDTDGSPDSDGWTVALLDGEGSERHDTGSYYTPDFIVKHIVERTVGPALKDAVSERASDEEKISSVLELNVLDPAMGSGHFLVEVTEYIARFLVGIGVSDEESETNPYDSDAELARWKRRVVQSCIYGVDLNPLAVELAKLSLWLSTVSKDRPLSFLDHHLRCGNSLVGATIPDPRPRGKGWNAVNRLKSNRRKPRAASGDSGQLSMLDDDVFRQSMSTAVGSMWEIEENPAESAAEVKEQERLYANIRADLDARYTRLADLATASSGFGVQPDPSLWNAVTAYATRNNAATLPQFERWLAESETIAKERRFFHWELEFPEVFFDRTGAPLGDDAGFDAVVGNPPYVQSKHFPDLKDYLKVSYPETYKGTADLYVYFFQLGLAKTRNKRRMGYISSGLFTKLAYGSPLREFLTSESKLLEMVEFGEKQVFKGAVTYPVILTMKKVPPEKDGVIGLLNITDLTGESKPELNPVPRNDEIWAFAPESLQHVIRGWKESRPLGQYLSGAVNRGVTTGLNDAFIVDRSTKDRLVHEDPSSEEIIKPLVRGESLSTWFQEHEDLHLIFARRGIDLSKYPAVLKHLDKFRDQLEPKPKNWKGRRWIGRKAGSFEWYEIQDSVNYYSAFEQPRIHSTKVSLFPTFSYSEEVSYALNTSYVLPVSAPESGNFLLGILNSRVSEFYCRKVFAPKANGYFEIQPVELSKLPIPDATEEELADIGRLAEEITAESRERYRLHERARRRIVSDLRPEGSEAKLNNKLLAWWDLDFPTFRKETKKTLKAAIPLSERDDWEDWLESNREKHRVSTAKIIAGETELNRLVYELFDLDTEEIKHIEKSTKYRYGEV